MRFRKKRVLFPLALIIIAVAWLLLPMSLFDEPYSTVVYDQESRLLGARIADDEQWRFPLEDSIPYKFEQSIIEFEDHRFYHHIGIHPKALVRAFVQNIKAKRIVSGGSTISMQVIRLARENKRRTYLEKLVEICLALKLEMRYSKEDILRMYAAHAPFGGNVVGLATASWRYYGRSMHDLSWAEAATLAVLPNAPALIHPARNRDLLRDKRNRLIDRLYQKNVIDSISCVLSKEEPLPGEPLPLPEYATHLTDYVHSVYKGKQFVSTIDLGLQQQLIEISKRYGRLLRSNQIHNMAILVAEVESAEVKGYLGNIAESEQAKHVDIIRSFRSTGSILKPFLFASMLNEGEILPNTLVADIPTYIGGFTPKNFDLKYVGAVPARIALARSMNVPAVRMLRSHSLYPFYNLLKDMGMSSLHRPADLYGLSLILGGCEGSLWEICGMYASMARVLLHFDALSGKYYPQDVRPLTLVANLDKLLPQTAESDRLSDEGLLSAAAIYQTFDALLKVNRPHSHEGWEFFSSSNRVAWKTGTSFGFRDAWSVGVTPEYVVGVWVGNATGDGRPGLTGVSAAAPIMFEVFDKLELHRWFDIPYDEMIKYTICRQSGHIAGPNCNDTEEMLIGKRGSESAACPYHQLVHIDNQSGERVFKQCANSNDMESHSWFVLPPAMEYYYKISNPSYASLPPFSEACRSMYSTTDIAIIYPHQGAQIFIPIEADGTKGRVVFEASHPIPDALLYWHVGEEYVGMTQSDHRIELLLKDGDYLLKVVDQNGAFKTVKFTVLPNEKL